MKCLPSKWELSANSGQSSNRKTSEQANVLGPKYRAGTQQVGPDSVILPGSIKRDHEQNEARLILCCDYELASDHEQARRVASEILKGDPDFSISTFTQTQPYKDRVTLDRLVSCLQEAGLPD